MLNQNKGLKSLKRVSLIRITPIAADPCVREAVKSACSARGVQFSEAWAWDESTLRTYTIAMSCTN